MAKPNLSSLVVFGVDCDTAGGGARSAQRTQTVERLARLFHRQMLPATWMVSRMDSPVTDVIRSEHPGHEIGLRCEDVPRSVAGSFEFSARLRDHVDTAAARGLAIHSLSADPRTPLPYCAVSKAGIRVVRPSRVTSRRQVAPVQPRGLRYGVWGLPVSCFWPHANRVVQPFVDRQVMHQVRRSLQQSSVIHVVFQLDQVAARWRAAEQLLTRVGELRHAHSSLQIVRLTDVSRMVQMATRAQPAAQSILRARAA